MTTSTYESEHPPRRATRLAAVALCSALAAAFAAAPVTAQSVEEFYRGNTISITVANAPGGAYDTYARLSARFLPKYIPGSPSIIVKNMPGAGGLVATNWLYSKAPRDGTAIGTYSNRAAFEPLFGNKKATFDPLKLNWLISISKQYVVGFVLKDHPARTIADLRKEEILVPGSGSSGSTVVMPTVFNALLDTKFKIVRGYQGQGEMLLSIERGETQGLCCTDYAAVMNQNGDKVRDGSIRFVIQAGITKHPDIPDVPWVRDMIKSPADKQVLDLFLAPQLIGRPYGMPPEVPADRVAAMRTAFAEMVKDPEFIAEAKKQGIGVDPAGPDEIMAMLREVFASPPEAAQRAQAIMKSVFAN